MRTKCTIKVFGNGSELHKPCDKFKEFETEIGFVSLSDKFNYCPFCGVVLPIYK